MMREKSYGAGKHLFAFNNPDYVLISRILVLLVMLGGTIVLIGWIFTIPMLTSILPTWVAMKFITALSFFWSGILVFLLAERSNGETKSELVEYLTTIISFTLLLLMVIFLISLLSGVSTGIENLFVKEAPGAVKTAVPGVPAIPTILCFILIGLVKLIRLALPHENKVYHVMGMIVTFVGGVAIVGYILDIPILYYYFSGYTPMAFPTALLFILLGIALIVFSKYHAKNGTMHLK